MELLLAALLAIFAGGVSAALVVCAWEAAAKSSEQLNAAIDWTLFIMILLEIG